MEILEMINSFSNFFFQNQYHTTIQVVWEFKKIPYFVLLTNVLLF